MLETMIQTNSTPYDFINVKKLELVGYESLANGGDQWGMGYLLVVDIFSIHTSAKQYAVSTHFFTLF